MSSLCSSWLYTLWDQSWCPTLPLLSLPTDLSKVAMQQSSNPQATGLSIMLRRDGDARYRLSSQNPSQDGFSLVGPSCPITPIKPSTDQSLLLHRNWWTLHVYRKKVPLLARYRWTPSMAGSSDLSVEERQSKQVGSFGSRSSTCRRWAMVRTCWRHTIISSLRPSITWQRPSPHKSNHSTADSGII